MKTPVARKLGMNPGMRALIIAPPPGYLKLLAPLPDGLTVSSRAGGMYPFVQVFATRLSEISRIAQKLSKHAAPNALVWISYPKKSSKTGGDLSRDLIREAMSVTGWRTVSIVAIDEVWSALRFRPAGQVGSREARPGLRRGHKTLPHRLDRKCLRHSFRRSATSLHRQSAGFVPAVFKLRSYRSCPIPPPTDCR
jgi:hypothetical protein